MEPFQAVALRLCAGLEVVRYQPGQAFHSHQDYLEAQEQQACGLLSPSCFLSTLREVFRGSRPEGP